MRLKSRLNVISKTDMEWIHAASLKILAETGIVFHSEEALTICRNHGAKVNGKIVCFPKKLVRQVLESSPE
jgi:trimethylamine--corrinoid protein Co-methyltransferase